MEEIKRFRAATPVITREAQESARARLMHEIHAAPAPVRRRLPRLAWRVALTGAFAVALGFGAVRLQAPPAVPVANVQELSERAARAAESRPAVTPSSDQWLYVKEKQAAPREGAGGFGVDLDRRVTREMWTSVDGRRVAWYRPDGKLLVQGTHPGISATDLAKPPITPQGLLDRIDRVLTRSADEPFEESKGERLFQAIYQLMGEQALSREVRAALFRALPLIKGVSVRQDAVDADGRHGVAFTYTGNWARYELILNPDDFRYLGTYGVSVRDRTFKYANLDPIFVPAGTPLGLSAQLETHLVNKAGERP
ncbi:CU044_5270 family protein [Thermopolyspora sp. NPDC052614]|uniref:CU044_5270 family protein n=1 Tax=Thermopolyspora sp. NPDC052614 TaxID=3155682 RepID=UPI003415260A